MADITAKMVMDLRASTGLPMMECKQALKETHGDTDAAKKWLRAKHKGKMEERAGRQTGEGRIGIFIDEAKQVGGIVELRCETAPVGANELFITLANAIAERVACGSEAAPDADAIRRIPDLDAAFTETYGKLAETMNLVTCRRVAGAHVVSYVHHDGKTGVLLALDAMPAAEHIGPDLCMHTAFAKPLAMDRSGIPDDEVEKVRSLARELAVGEGKPEQIIDKIVTGKIEAFYAQTVLTEQLHARSDVYGKKKVGDVLKEAGVGAVVGMAIMKIGG